MRYRGARRDLADLGYDTTIDYLVAMSRLVLDETGLLPHANPGILTRDELAALREVSVSQGIMLESASERLCEKGGPHFGSPDKRPAVRLKTIRLAGELAIPFTSGILIGIGETWEERVDSLFALRDLHDRYGHIQEIIIQNFRAKPDTKMAGAPEPDRDDLMRTIAVARLILRGRDEHTGPTESDAGGLWRSHRGRDQRLGRRVSGHTGSRQSRGAVAASRRVAAQNRSGGQRAGRTSRRLSRLRP